jgi:hypothetical protein
MRVSLLAVVMLVAGPAQPDAHTLLLAHFDASCTADLAQGNATAEVKGATVVTGASGAEPSSWGRAVAQLRPGR